MLRHMRTTIILPDHLVAEAKRYAAQRKRTLTSVIEESLRVTLKRGQRSSGSQRKVKLPTFKGDGVLPGINLNNSAALLDAMDAAD